MRIGSAIRCALAIYLGALLCAPFIARAETLSPIVDDAALEDVIATFRPEGKRHATQYGTAILFDVNAHEALYMTSAHLLPADSKQWATLQMRGVVGENPYWAFRPQVIGIDLGLDLAVLSVKLQPLRAMVAKRASVRTRLKELLLPQNEQTISGIAAIIGMPHGLPSLELKAKTQDWRQEALALQKAYGQVAVSRPETAFAQATATTLTLVQNCPILFAERCWRVPIRTWGYSGGALITYDSRPGGAARIIGLISQYLPLKADTFALPMLEALPAAQELVVQYRKSKTVVIRTQSQDGMYELAKNGDVVLRKGRLQGARIGYETSFELPSFGGSPAEKGLFRYGGDGMGGGEANWRNQVIRSYVSGHNSSPIYLLNAPGLAAKLTQPASWGETPDDVMSAVFSLSSIFRGSDAWLGRIRIPDLLVRQSGHSLQATDSSEFKRLYRGLEPERAQATLPSVLFTAKNDTPGYYGFDTIVRSGASDQYWVGGTDLGKMFGTRGFELNRRDGEVIIRFQVLNSRKNPQVQETRFKDEFRPVRSSRWIFTGPIQAQQRVEFAKDPAREFGFAEKTDALWGAIYLDQIGDGGGEFEISGLLARSEAVNPPEQGEYAAPDGGESFRFEVSQKLQLQGFSSGTLGP